MDLKDIGESGLIGRIAHALPTGADIVAGIGDDAAVIRSAMEKTYVLIATDAILEGVHFTVDALSPADIGRKAIAVNLSDIAAMGGRPKYAVISLGLRPDVSVEFCDGLYSGMRVVAEEYGLEIVGGDTVCSDAGIFLAVTIIGEVESDRVVLRSGARTDDSLLVTGALGGSRKKRHYSFVPRVREAEFLTAQFHPTAMIDISDGLLSDLNKICMSSNLGAVLYAREIPLSPDADVLSSRADSSVVSVLDEGEDFELLFTLPFDETERALEYFHKEVGTELTVIGKMAPPPPRVSFVHRDGRIEVPAVRGYDHFGNTACQ